MATGGADVEVHGVGLKRCLREWGALTSDGTGDACSQNARVSSGISPRSFRAISQPEKN